jgi:predicted dehydrogenase
MAQSQLRIAIIGCGAVTELVHLPELAKMGVRPALLVDKNIKRAELLANKFGVPWIGEDYRSGWTSVGGGHSRQLDGYDAAIIALPHHLHAPVSIELLEKGIHLLVEKPMAMSSAETEVMIAAARKSSATLAVGLARRFVDSAIWVKAALDASLLGDIQSFDIQEGYVYSWPIASSFMFRREAGGGVLMDTGAHTLDLMLWWLGDVTRFVYLDDSYGGVEANCEMHLTMKSGASGFVSLSRTRSQRNTAIIRGTRGEIEVPVFGNRLQANPQSLLRFKAGNVAGDKLKPRDTKKIRVRMFEDWFRAIEEHREPAISGGEGARSIALIESLLANRQLLEYPWMKVGKVQEVA